MFKLRPVAALVLLTYSLPLLANPSGATVVSGKVTMNQNGTTLTITNTPNSIINWKQFSIDAGETVRFVQQSASSSVLNRVTGADPSVILGNLQSNGKVFLINPNGILFGQGSVVDVAGLVASTLNISDADFLAGKMHFSADRAGVGAVQTVGKITTPGGGFVYLIAPNIENKGVISAPNGEIILAAGNTVELVDSDNPSLHVQVSAEADDINITQAIRDAGGNVMRVLNTGTLQANATETGEAGRVIAKSAGNITTTETSVIEAKGFADKNGGKVVLFANDSGMYQGLLDVTGSLGGFLETSGKLLSVNGADIRVGWGGEWLLDPVDVIIRLGGGVSAGDTSYIDSATIQAQLDTGANVGVSTGFPGAAAGNITVEAGSDIVSSGAGTFTMSADRNIAINSNISTGGEIRLQATGTITDAFALASGGSITLGGVGDNPLATEISYSGIMSAGGRISLTAATLDLTAANLTGAQDVGVYGQSAVTLNGTQINAGVSPFGTDNNSVTITGNVSIVNSTVIAANGILVGGSWGELRNSTLADASDKGIHYSANSPMTVAQTLTITDSNLSSNGDIDINAYALVVDNSAMSAGGTLALASDRYNKAGGDVTLTGASLSGFSVDLMSSGFLNGDSATSVMGQAVGLQGRGGVDFHGILDAGFGTVNISGGGLLGQYWDPLRANVSLSGMINADTLVVSGQDIALAADVTAGMGGVQLSAAGAINLGGMTPSSITVSWGSLTVNAAQGVTVDNTTIVADTGINIQANDTLTVRGGSMYSGGFLSLVGINGVTLTDTQLAGDFGSYVDAWNGAITLEGTGLHSMMGDVGLNAMSDLSLVGPTTIDGNQVTLTSQTGTFSQDPAATVTAVGLLSVSAMNSWTYTGGLFADEGLSLISQGGDLTIGADLTTTGSVSLIGMNVLGLGDATVTAADVMLSVFGDYTYRGGIVAEGVSLSAGGLLTMTAELATSGNMGLSGAMISLEGASLTGRAVSMDTYQSGTLQMDAASSVNAMRLDVSAAGVSLQGTVNVANNATIRSESLDWDTYEVIPADIDISGPMTVGKQLTIDGKDVSLSAMISGETGLAVNAAGQLTLTGAQLASGGNAALTANSGINMTDSTVIAQGDVALAVPGETALLAMNNSQVIAGGAINLDFPASRTAGGLVIDGTEIEKADRFVSNEGGTGFFDLNGASKQIAVSYVSEPDPVVEPTDPIVISPEPPLDNDPVQPPEPQPDRLPEPEPEPLPDTSEAVQELDRTRVSTQKPVVLPRSSDEGDCEGGVIADAGCPVEAPLKVATQAQ